MLPVWDIPQNSYIEEDGTVGYGLDLNILKKIYKNRTSITSPRYVRNRLHSIVDYIEELMEDEYLHLYCLLQCCALKLEYQPSVILEDIGPGVDLKIDTDKIDEANHQTNMMLATIRDHIDSL